MCSIARYIDMMILFSSELIAQRKVNTISQVVISMHTNYWRDYKG